MMTEQPKIRSGWISVADELPPLAVPVVLFNGTNAYIGVRSYEGHVERWWIGSNDMSWSADYGWDLYSGFRIGILPTHWHRLPDPSEVTT